MALTFHDAPTLAFWDGTVNNPDQTILQQPGANRQYEGASANIRSVAMDPWSLLPSVMNTTPGTHPGGTGQVPVGFMANQHHDMHYKLWVLPAIMQLSNPQLGVDIPFRLWNTNTVQETVTSVLVNGSSALTFDVTPGDLLREFQFRNVNMQIQPGEPTIDAVVQFNTTNLTGELKVIALISDTFNLIPDVPIKEVWEFLTDVIPNRKGVEQRIALRRYPRIRQEFDFEIIDLRQRREQYNVVRKNIAIQSLVPMYQYSVNLDRIHPIGANKFYLDNAHSNFRAGEFVVMVNPTTEDLFISKISTVDADGITTESTSGQEMTPHWVAAPAMNCLLNNGSGITMQNVTGRLNVKADSFTEPTLVRPGATRTIDMFDSIPLVNRRPNIPADEKFRFEREIIDNQVGERDINSSWLHPKVEGERTFTIQRISDPNEMDYWRSLFDTVRGGQQSFLLATWFPDLTHHEVEDHSETSSLVFNEGYYASLYHQYDTWRRIQIEYPNGEVSHHRVDLVTLNEDGTCVATFIPQIPTGSNYQKIKWVSFLQRVKATDRVVLRHYANYSEVSFGIFSSDE